MNGKTTQKRPRRHKKAQNPYINMRIRNVLNASVVGHVFVGNVTESLQAARTALESAGYSSHAHSALGDLSRLLDKDWRVRLLSQNHRVALLVADCAHWRNLTQLVNVPLSNAAWEPGVASSIVSVIDAGAARLAQDLEYFTAVAFHILQVLTELTNYVCMLHKSTHGGLGQGWSAGSRVVDFFVQASQLLSSSSEIGTRSEQTHTQIMLGFIGHAFSLLGFNLLRYSPQQFSC
jgi:hypothetical protein